ncbi:hypothetical protein R6Q57_007751 [Mikania cordata]
MGHQKAIDYDLLTELGQQERMMTIIGEDMPWFRLFDVTYAPQYRLITVEFLSTFMYRPQGPDFQSQPEFASVLGLYTEQETHMPIYTTAIHTADDAVVSAWWPRIGDEPFVRCARVTRIRDPLIRSQDGVGHAYRAEVPTARASIFARKGGHLAAGAK